MTRSEFIEATSRLEQYYDKEYNTQQLQIMYEELSNFDVNRYRQLISAVIRKSKFLPKVADIIGANAEEPYTNSNADKEVVDCNKCKGTGYVLYTKLIDNGVGKFKNIYGAVCSCGNAKQYKGWEVNDSEHRTNFYTPLAQELGI
ncbi:MAG: hypothetical protein IKL68_02010 [Clostridia bacterium]|nr:hypothetical protein [Clostridia bacterium]